MLLQDSYPDEIAGKWKPDWDTPPVYQPALTGQIKWRNYYDYGDPVGFKLPIVCRWLADHGVKMFDFGVPGNLGEDNAGHDIGFARYLFPGEAHNEYWKDDEVFDHFIHEVVDRDQPRPNLKRRLMRAEIVGYLVSYGVSLVLLMAAVFLVDRAIIAYNPPPASGDGENPSPLLKAFEKGSDILGISILLCGVTVLARIPRLINDQHFWQWNGRALIIFALCGFLYALCVSPETQRNVGALPAGLMPYIGMKGYTDPGSRFSMLTLATVLVGMVIAIGSAAASRASPDWA